MSTRAAHSPQSNEPQHRREEFVPKAKKSRGQRLRAFLWRGLRNTLTFVVLTFLGIMFTLAIPSVQTLLGQMAIQRLAPLLGFEMSLERLQINLINQTVTLRELKVYEDQRPLFDIGLIEIAMNPLSGIQGADIFIDKIVLASGEVSLVYDTERRELNIDKFIAAINELTAPKEPRPKRDKSPLFVIHEAELEDMRFSYYDIRQDSIYDAFDYAHFRLERLNGHLQHLLVVADTIEFQADNLRAVEEVSGLKIKNLTTLFRLNERSMQFNQLYAEINRSVLKDSLVFNFENIGDMSDFVEKVDISARLDSSQIHTRDLALFAPALKPYSDVWQLSGNFQGTIQDFFLQDFSLRFGDQSLLAGTMSAEGLPDLEEMLASIDIRSAHVFAEDLRQYVPDPDAQAYINRLDNVRFKGRFDGFVSDFVANGEFETALGNLQSDLQLVLRSNRGVPFYRGKLATSGFELGKLLGQEATLQGISLNGRVEGFGFDLASLDTRVDVKVKSLGMYAYNYQNISLNGRISEKYIKGEFLIDDAHAQAALKGEIDLRPSTDSLPRGILNVTGFVESIDLQAVKILPKEALISSKFDIHTRGTSLEDLVGNAYITNTLLRYDGQEILMDSLRFFSSKKEGKRKVELLSDLLSLYAEGDFSFEGIVAEVQDLVYEYGLAFKNDREEIVAYYQKKKEIQKKKARRPFYIDYDIHLNHINELVRLIEKDFYLSEAVRLTGLLRSSDSVSFVLETLESIDSLRFGKFAFQQLNAGIDSHKSHYDNNILAQLDISSLKQDLQGFETEQWYFNTTWYEGAINFRNALKQYKQDNEVYLEGYVDFEAEKTSLVFESSFVKVADKQWEFVPERRVSLLNDAWNTILFEGIELRNNGQRISLEGALADSAAHKQLNVDIEGFNLDFLDPVLGKDIEGDLSAQVVLRDVYQQILFDGDINVEGFAIDGFFFGDISAKAAWDAPEKKVRLEASVYSRVDYVLFAEGDYTPATQALDFLLDFRNMELNVAEPFLREYVSRMSGQISGQMKLKGTIQEPQIIGIAKVEAGRFRINYLGTLYEFSDRVFFTENEIRIRRMTLNDRFGQSAQLRGSIFHESFKNIRLDLNADFQNFNLLNLQEGENSTFYGTAFATGNLLIKGPAEQLDLTINAKSERNTKIFIPLDGYEQTAEKDYIQFVNFKEQKSDSGSVQNSVRQINLSGLTITMNLDLTSDASFEIIFDKRAGDMIKGTGQGKLQLIIDNRGEMSIWGDYYIRKGTYTFTLLNLLNKSFNVRENSVIYFTGGLLNATMNVEASYDQLVSLEPLLDRNIVANSNNAEFSRRYPIGVILRLEGSLLAPTIKLDIDFYNLENTLQNIDLKSALLNFKARIINDELELNRQAFSLIAFRRFSAENSFSGVSGSGSTVSELLSNQLSHWMSQVDENLQIDLDLSGLDANNSAFQVRLSYTLLNGRLRVTRGGIIDAQNQSAAANIVGEWTVEYLLTEDGRYRLKMYNRNLQNNLAATNLGNQTLTSAGVSLQYTQSFNSLRDLFRSKKKKNKMSQEELIRRENEEDKLRRRLNKNDDEVPEEPKVPDEAPSEPPAL